MQAFEYEALDTAGRAQKGIVSADSPRSARRELKKRNLMPVSLRETRSKPGLSLKRGASKTDDGERTKLSHKERTLITRQLATLIGAAAPIEQALNTIAGQSDKANVKRCMLAMRADILEGRRLADALRRRGKAFDQLYIAMVSAGENAGSLPAVLDRLADYMERTQAVRTKVQTALIYPACLAVVALGVIVALMTFVVPRVVEQFDGVGQTLPFLTRLMIGISDFLVAYGLILGVVIVLAVIAFARALQYASFRLAFDQFCLGLPVLGRLIRQMNGARFARTLGTLFASGVPIVSGLEASAKTMGNRVLRRAIEAMTHDVKEGKALSATMRRGAYFPPMLVYMVAAGENSGTLADMLSKAAHYMEAEFESFTDAALSLLEPLIIIIMGAIVATIVLSILMPILQLNSLALSG